MHLNLQQSCNIVHSTQISSETLMELGWDKDSSMALIKGKSYSKKNFITNL
jgi:hypothetical protein